MKKMSHWAKPVALFAIVLSAVGSMKAPAAVSGTTPANTIQDSEPTSFQRQGNFRLAQGGLVGQCRAAKQRIFVYSQRSTTSQTIRTLAPNEQVTLADNGSGGWIAISSPATGYVQANNLTACSGVVVKPTPTPNQTSSLCRVVTYNGPEGGLAVRSRPEKSAPRIAGVYLGSRVTLRTSPPPSTLDREGRAWVEITAPSRGWISNGFPSTKSTNTGPCP